MRNFHSLLVLVFFITTLGCQHESPDKASNTLKCLTSFKVDDSTGIDKNYIQSGIIDYNSFRRQEVILAKTFAEHTINIDSSILPSSTSTPFFAIDTLNNSIIANSTLLNNINRTSALKNLKNIEVTTIKDSTLSHKSQIKNFIKVLMHLEIVETYMHLYADICLVTEEETEQNITLTYHVTHHFCTQQCDSELHKVVFTFYKDNGKLIMN